MDYNLFELLAHASIPVQMILGVLAIMAIGCLYVAIERTWSLGKARNQSRDLAAALNEPFSKGDFDGALKIVRKDEYKASYLGHLLEKGLSEFALRPDKHGVEAAARAMRNQSVGESALLNKGIGVLATTGSTSPFVGLVGTIFGIINAFQGMAESGSGGLGSVAAGIAEALWATAFGITVAILGVWLFNWFNGKIAAISDDMGVASQEFLDWCEKQVLPPMEDAAK
ncbi:MAG: MotA/TolQ/ExbB proton channel family protein [Alphaproteobacteria bacterium]|nr:MotA/TolQ/ExbB proton channel family protein [Alphaproteobacteria bacterium]